MLNACSILTAKTVTGDAGSWRAIDRPSGVRFGAKSAISARRPSAGRYGGPGGFTTSSRSRLRRFSATPIQVRFSLTPPHCIHEFNQGGFHGKADCRPLFCRSARRICCD